ncbi:MAG TPA: hypothetical protein G4O02_02040 [Caldilineae bacterium]|nr:hypothetical protein [Caldilineae bacterium]
MWIISSPLGRRVSVFCLATALLLGLVAPAGLAQAAPPMEATALTRDFEPIIVRGGQAPLLSGAPLDQIFVYREVGGIWEQIPFQIDELTASGTYTATEDGVWDANDEVVFMAGDLGDRATTSIVAALPITGLWYEVEVRDPTNPSQRGWAYIVRSTVLTDSVATDYVDYLAPNRRVRARSYEVGWAASHAGLDYMTLFGGDDILDRTKLRVKYRIWPLPQRWVLTEDNLPAPELRLVKDGPVRVIVQRGGATTLAYASLLQTTSLIDLSGLPGNVIIDEIRVSSDLTGTITNATFYNENVPAGVTIDGTPDAVPTTPFTHPWRQISLDDGTIVQVVSLGETGGTLSHYYKDDATVDPDDTGDHQSFGDSGVLVVGPTERIFSVKSVQYILPGRQSNRGAEFYGIFQSPLQVTVRAQARYHLFAPSVLRGQG